MRRHIVIIGGGPAGIEAARAAASAGSLVTLIYKGPFGGRASWNSLLSSKAWLTNSEIFYLLRMAPQLKYDHEESAATHAATAFDRIHKIMRQWIGRQSQLLHGLDVQLLAGVAQLIDPHTVRATHPELPQPTTLHADAIIIATGSIPRCPEGMRPDGKLIIAPRIASRLEGIPASVLVIGGGVTASEFAHLFNLLGSSVTWLIDTQGVLPGFPRAASRAIIDVLTNRGVKIIENQPVPHLDCEDRQVTALLADGTRVSAAIAFLAVGRKPDFRHLNLAAVGLQANERGEVAVDGYGRTAIPSIYMVGDAAGEPMLANRATAQAWIAGRHAAGRPSAPFRAETVVHAVYSDPQIAMVGTIDVSDPVMIRIQLPFTATLKTYLQNEEHGMIELIYHQQTRCILGGVAIGPQAAEVLAPVALAIQAGATIEDLAATAGAHPTFSELAFLAARYTMQ